MNLRERFLEVMSFGPARTRSSGSSDTGARRSTISTRQVLPKKNYPELPQCVTTPTSSLYIPAWTSIRNKLPSGIGVMGGGLYWPTQGFPLDTDVRDFCGMDQTQRMVDVNLHFCPMFESEVLSEDDESMLYTDIDGVTRKFLKEQATIPAGMAGRSATRRRGRR